MLKALSLILPVLVPSWRFFKTVEPSPRVEWRLVCADGEGGSGGGENWCEFRPRPARLSALQLLGRLFWNPAWNESLFLVSCAERLQEHPTDHSINQIRARIEQEISRRSTGTPNRHLQFRLVFLCRVGTQQRRETVFVSDLFPPCPGAGH